MRQLLFILTLALAPLGNAVAAEVSACSRIEADASRTLCHEAIVAAPAAEVWRLWSTSEGLRSWAAPVAAIDLRIGGIWEASYAPAAALGDPANIRNRVLSFLPGRMLSIAIDRAPPGFPHADEARTLWTVIELEPVNETSTRVRVSMLGYLDGPAFDQLHAMFEHGNAQTLEALAARVENGPAQWSAP